MCEIVRAAIAGGKFEKVTMDLVNIPIKVIIYNIWRYLIMWIVLVIVNRLNYVP